MTAATPRVSACVVTYNHERYIENALLSALQQRTRFPFEVIVGDDGSTDRTVEVIRAVARRHPNLRVIAHPRNIGVTKNYLSVHDSAQGEYVAHLDGDDFWLPGKLQAQLDTMEARPDCAISWHPMIAFDEAGEHHVIGDHKALLEQLFGKDRIDLGDALLGYGMGGYHSSSMYRRSARNIFAYEHPFLIDYRLSLSFLEAGYGYHLRRPLGCYRRFRDQSATRGGRDHVGPGLLRTLREYAATHPHLRRQIAAHCLSLMGARTKFQLHLAERLVARGWKPAQAPHSHASATPAARGPVVAKVLRSQRDFALNSLRFLPFWLSLGVLPSWTDVEIGARVAAFHAAARTPKTGFFEKRYAPPELERTTPFESTEAP